MRLHHLLLALFFLVLSAGSGELVGALGGAAGSLSLLFLPPSVLLPSSTRGQTKPTAVDASEKPALSP